MKKVVIIGGGFSSLSASCYLAKEGYEVTLLEKNTQVGGRARQLIKEGYTFDIGPTFYWMPDVFESFFQDFGKKVEDYYELNRLTPSYRVFFGSDQFIDISDKLDQIKSVFESIETGSSQALTEFLQEAQENYELAIQDLVYQPGQNIQEIITWKTVKKLRLFFTNIRSQVSKKFKNPHLRKTLEFPVLFLGAHPQRTPAFYNFMNYADFVLGTWHPKGGMYSVVRAMQSLAEELGVRIYTEAEVSAINIQDGKAISVTSAKGEHSCDIVLSGADYAHTEQILPQQYRQYKQSYWKKKVFAPSALLFYVGFNKKLSNVVHHSLFFDVDFEKHSKAIYDEKKWPEEPLFYASFPSLTEPDCAPQGCESGIFLVPLATDLEDNSDIRKKYFEILIHRLENITGQSIRDSVTFYESYCINDFKKDYHSYGGNAYGLANTLLQTHILRPKLKSKKVSNLYFTGQLTVPGPGVPPSLISGKIVSELINRYV